MILTPRGTEANLTIKTLQTRLKVWDKEWKNGKNTATPAEQYCYLCRTVHSVVKIEMIKNIFCSLKKIDMITYYMKMYYILNVGLMYIQVEELKWPK